MSRFPLRHLWSISKPQDEYAKALSALRSLWSVLPSAEARASKLGKNNSWAPVSLASALPSQTWTFAPQIIIRPQDGFSSPTIVGDFSIDEFVIRVQALLADDRRWLNGSSLCAVSRPPQK